MCNQQMQAAMQDLQEAMSLLGRIEKRRNQPVLNRSALDRSEKLRLRIDKNLAEISEKLNRLIGPQ
jgi:hypothetical protein